MNNITIAGSLGRDAELVNLKTGESICKFSVADSMGRDKPTIWWEVSLFGKRGESLVDYLKKGQAVAVSGIITENEWTDKDGNKRKQMQIRATDIALQGGRKESSPAPAKQAPRKAVPQADDFESDDIPFISCSMGYDMGTSKQRRMNKTIF